MALKLDAENKRFVLDVGKDQLVNAPGFDKDHWPDMADPAWEESIHAHYCTRPYGEPARTWGLRRRAALASSPA